VQLAQLPDCLLSSRSHQGIFSQPLLIQGPFDETEAKLAAKKKLPLPILPGESLNSAPNRRRESSLHETNLGMGQIVDSSVYLKR